MNKAACASAVCITLDAWRAAVSTPLLCISWNLLDEEKWLRCVPTSTLNTGSSSKFGEQFRCIVNEIVKESEIVGSDSIRIRTVSSDNEAAFMLASDLMTDYVEFYDQYDGRILPSNYDGKYVLKYTAMPSNAQFFAQRHDIRSECPLKKTARDMARASVVFVNNSPNLIWNPIDDDGFIFSQSENEAKASHARL